MEGALVERFLRRVVPVAARIRPATVLDAGCGEGVVSARLRSALPDARIVGVDTDNGALREASARVPGASFGLGDVQALPFADGEFDLVVCTEVLEHVDDPPVALAELRRVARRAVLVTVPHEPWFRAGNLARGRYLRRLGSTPGHRWTWTRRGFNRLVGPGAHRFEAFPWQGAISAKRPA